MQELIQTLKARPTPAQDRSMDGVVDQPKRSSGLFNSRVAGGRREREKVRGWLELRAAALRGVRGD